MKPDWKDAPEWAKYLARDCLGSWRWFEAQPLNLSPEVTSTNAQSLKMETIYKYPFDEAKAQWVIDKLLYDEPWELWEVRGDYDSRFMPMGRTPKFIIRNNIYKRTEPKDGNDL